MTSLAPRRPFPVTPAQRHGREGRGRSALVAARTASWSTAGPRRDRADAILASWGRSRLWGVRPHRLELGLEPGTEQDSPLSRAAEPVLRDVADLFATEPVSVILCDTDGVVLSRRTGDSGLEQYLDRVWLAPGFSYSEQMWDQRIHRLEARGTARVWARALREKWSRVPRRRSDPRPGRAGCSGSSTSLMQRDAGPLLVATAGTLSPESRGCSWTTPAGGSSRCSPTTWPPAGATGVRCSPSATTC